jgi:hypothetical protein
MNLRKHSAALVLLAAAGCASVSPQRVAVDRMDYGQVLAESWKRQTLLNVVRLRYADAPVFLDVASVINSYSVGGSGNLSGGLQSSPGFNNISAGIQGTWSNTPTVTYQPVMGDRFTKSMLQPVPPVAVFQLLQGGWPADIVMRTVVGSINGLRNDSAGVSADPGFRELVDAFSRIQRRGGLGIRVDAGKEGSGVVIVLRRADVDPAVLEDARQVRTLLGTEEGAGEFAVEYGLIPRNKREVAIITRSMLELLLQLGFGIELPAGHLSEGRVLPGRAQSADSQVTALARIRSGLEAPADAYAAVPYKGHWYWIDDTDVASKRMFTFLLILFSLAETGQSSAAPLVTVPSR